MTKGKIKKRVRFYRKFLKDWKIKGVYLPGEIARLERAYNRHRAKSAKGDPK